ncbi:MAG: hypothetical protein J2P57_00145 [Acidimicrobiaceae bacterium]|nr:hypothetical protein [Acidimicrobiaceae bacterium]
MLGKPASPAARKPGASEGVPIRDQGRPGRAFVWPVSILVADGVLAVLLFWSTWSHPANSWIGDGRDPHIFFWGLAWWPHSLGTLARHPLFTDYIMYPGGANLMWSISVIFPAVVLWPVTALFGPVVAFNVAMTGAFALSSWCAYLVVRRYSSNEVVSAAAGTLYGFSPYMTLQSLGHLHMTIAIFPPLIWLLLDELLVRRRWRPQTVGVVMGLAATAQLLTSTEILSTTALVATLGVILLALLSRRRVREVLPRALVGGIVGLLTFLVFSAYPLKNLFFGPQRVSGVLNVPDVHVADLLSFVVPAGYRIQSALWPLPWPSTANFTGLGVETGGVYLGLTGLAVLALALVAGWRWEVVRFAALLAAVAMVLSMGAVLHLNGQVTNVPLPWAVMKHVPLIASAIPARLSLYGWLGLAVVFGVVGAGLVARGRRERVIVAVASAVLIVPIFPTPPMLSTPASAPKFFNTDGGVSRIPKGSVALIVPFSNETSSTTMYWQAVGDFRFRMPEGEAYVPGPSLSPPPSAVQTDLVELEAGRYPDQPPSNEREAALVNLRQWNVETIVVGPTPGQSKVVAYFTRVIGRRPERTGGVWVWWHVRTAASG